MGLADAIPAEMREMPRWVCAGPSSKRPMKPYDGGPASVSDPSTWGTFEQAAECVERGLYTHVGFVFADDGLVGIDIDGAIGEDGMLSADAARAVTACDSYSEISRSGKGVHIVCRASLPFRGRNNGSGWEAYRDARFFVMTGAAFHGKGRLSDSQDGVDLVVSEHFGAKGGGASKGAGDPPIWEPDGMAPASPGKVSLRMEWPQVCAGSRHLSMVSFCGRLWKRGCPYDALARAAQRVNLESMDPPLPEDEVARIVASVRRYRR